MGNRRFCDNCNADESNELKIYQTQVILRSLPGRTKSYGMQVGPVKGMANVQDPKTGDVVESPARVEDLFKPETPSEIYFMGTRDLCLNCITGMAGSENKGRREGIVSQPV
jgi:hypothetical protein